jgi:hypothetical protein
MAHRSHGHRESHGLLHHGEDDEETDDDGFVTPERKALGVARHVGASWLTCGLLTVIVILLAIMVSVLIFLTAWLLPQMHVMLGDVSKMLEEERVISQLLIEFGQQNGYNVRDAMTAVLPRNQDELVLYSDDVVNGFRSTMRVLRQLDELDMFGVLTPVVDVINEVFHADAAPAVARAIGTIVEFVSSRAESGDLDRAARLIESSVGGITTAIKDPQTMQAIRSIEGITANWLGDASVQAMLGNAAELMAEFTQFARSERTKHLIERGYTAAEAATEGDKIHMWIALAEQMGQATTRIAQQFVDEDIMLRLRDVPGLLGNVTQLARALRQDFRTSGLLIRIPSDPGAPDLDGYVEAPRRAAEVAS